MLLSIVNKKRMLRVLRFMLDESEFLSPYGIRSLSKYHQEHPFILTLDGRENRVDYEPAESTTPLFGGNSNWRGPVWFPVNFLLIEALQRYHYYYGNDLKVEFPNGSGQQKTLWEVAARDFTPSGREFSCAERTAAGRSTEHRTFSERPALA